MHRHMYDRLFIQGDLLNIIFELLWIEDQLRTCGYIANSVSDGTRKRMEDVARIAGEVIGMMRSAEEGALEEEASVLAGFVQRAQESVRRVTAMELDAVTRGPHEFMVLQAREAMGRLPSVGWAGVTGRQDEAEDEDEDGDEDGDEDVHCCWLGCGCADDSQFSVGDDSALHSGSFPPSWSVC